MRISQRSLVAIVALARARRVLAPRSRSAPEPLRLTRQPRTSFTRLRQAQAQTQTAQGELLDVDVKASTLTIKTPTAEMTFRYNDQTKVTGAQKGCPVSPR